MDRSEIARGLLRMAKQLTAGKLTDDEIIALGQALKLKPSYRDKFEDAVYEKLQSMKYMNSRRAITKFGRKYILTEGRDHFNKVFKKSSALLNLIREGEYDFYKQKGMVSSRGVDNSHAERLTI